MNQLTPERNMLLLANAAELATLVVQQLVGQKEVSEFFSKPEARAVIATGVVTSIQRNLQPQIRGLSTGQFLRSVQEKTNISNVRQVNAA